MFFSESLHILAERLSQSEIVLPLKKTCYYSPLAEVGVFSTEIKVKISPHTMIKGATCYGFIIQHLLKNAHHAI